MSEGERLSFTAALTHCARLPLFPVKKESTTMTS